MSTLFSSLVDLDCAVIQLWFSWTLYTSRLWWRNYQISFEFAIGDSVRLWVCGYFCYRVLSKKSSQVRLWDWQISFEFALGNSVCLWICGYFCYRVLSKKSGSEAMRDRILKFHWHCTQFMCSVSLATMQSKNIHHGLRVSDILSILEARLLQWLGHVFRMPEERLLRRMLTAWISAPRPQGRPPLTYAQGISNDLKTHGLLRSWSRLAVDRPTWRNRIQSVRKSQPDRGCVLSNSGFVP